MAQSSAGNCSGDRAYLGIYSHSVSAEKAGLLELPNDNGCLITSVLTGGAADKAGLQAFDYIYGIDDFRMDDGEKLSDLLSNYQAGDQATVHLVRKGRMMTVDLTFGRPSDDTKQKRGKATAPFLGISNRDSDDTELGVWVSIIDNSTAEEMGLQSGDKVTAINGFPVVDWLDITTAINMMEVGEPVEVAYEREGKSHQASALIKSRETTQVEEKVSQSGEHAFFGIESRSISKAKAKKLGFDNPYGSYVDKVIGNTAAERAGIQPFDYIYGIDEYRTGEGQSLGYLLQRYAVGDRATIHYVRQNRERQAPVTFGSRDERRYEKVDRCDEPFFGVRSSHTYVERTGVLVEILSNSTAKSLGMQTGDLITRINGYPMIDWEDISAAINNMKSGNAIAIEWLRNGKEMEARGPIMSYCQYKTNQIVPDRIPSNVTPRSGTVPNVGNLEVVVSDINSLEASEMKRRYRVELKPANEIQLRSIRIATRPEKGVFQLSFELPNRGETVVRIYNNLGRNIYVYDLGPFSGQFSDEVDLSQNGVGTYYLLVKQNGKSAAKRLMVRKG